PVLGYVAAQVDLRIGAVVLIQFELAQYPQRQPQRTRARLEIESARLTRRTQSAAETRLGRPARRRARVGEVAVGESGAVRRLLGSLGLLNGGHGLLVESRACACSESGNWLRSRLP